MSELASSCSRSCGLLLTAILAIYFGRDHHLSANSVRMIGSVSDHTFLVFSLIIAVVDGLGVADNAILPSTTPKHRSRQQLKIVCSRNRSDLLLPRYRPELHMSGTSSNSDSKSREGEIRRKVRVGACAAPPDSISLPRLSPRSLMDSITLLFYIIHLIVSRKPIQNTCINTDSRAEEGRKNPV